MHFYFAYRYQAKYWPSNAQLKEKAELAPVEYGQRGFQFTFDTSPDMTFRQLGTPSGDPAKVVLLNVPLAIPADLEDHRRKMLASLAWIECDGGTQWIEYVSPGLASVLQTNRYARKTLHAVGVFKYSLSRPLCPGFESLVDGLSVRF